MKTRPTELTNQVLFCSANSNLTIRHVLATDEFHVPPIKVPTFSPFIAFEMLPGLFRLKTTTASMEKKLHEVRNTEDGERS